MAFALEVARLVGGGSDGGGIGFFGGAVFKLHFAFFLDVEAEILEQHNRPGGEFSASGFDGGTDAVIEKRHGPAEEFLQLRGDGLERELGDLLAIGPAEVRHEHHRRALFQSKLDRRQRRDDALGIGDGTGNLVLRDVEIDAHEDALAGEVEVADGFEFWHG